MQNYNIMVVEDDPVALEDLVLMYEDMVEWGDFSHKISGEGSVSAARSAAEAEEKLEENLSRDSDLVQILHVDQRMPGEQGSDFVDRMRHTYTDANMGAILVTAYATDVSVQNSREKGVYRYVPKPVTPDVLKPHMDNLFDMIQLKQEPEKKDVEGVYQFRLITTPEEVLELMRLRYHVWDKLNYIPEDRRSPETQLEVDEYDGCSIHLGGFTNVDGKEKLVTTSRIITPEVQPKTDKVFKEVLQEHGDQITWDSYNRERRHPSIIYENYSQLLERFFENTGGDVTSLEYSRFINHPDFRGLDLSIKTVQFLHMYSRFDFGADYAFVECVMKHKDMNIEKNSFTGPIPGAEQIAEGRAAQVIIGLYAHLSKFDFGDTQYKREMHAMHRKFRRQGTFCYCRERDCIAEDYKLENTLDCPSAYSR